MKFKWLLVEVYKILRYRCTCDRFFGSFELLVINLSQKCNKQALSIF